MTVRLAELVNALTRCWKEEGHQTFWWPKLLEENRVLSQRRGSKSNHRVAIGVFDPSQQALKGA
jgi:hypothetical protein